MKIKQLFAYCLLAGTFLLASCDNETLPDGDGAGTPLPEGMYPLTFTATQDDGGGVQTRVSENQDGMGSTWTAGDQIKVVVSDGGNAAETTCTLDGSGNITAYNPKLYWKTTQNSKINAWYSNITGGDATTASSTVNLANQTSGLAYVLKADEKTGVNYKSSNIQLQFTHQLAKVRVKVVKGTYTGNLNITGVKVKGYTSCTVSKGMVSNGGNTNYISMRKNGDYYEANLVPGLALQTEAFEITADGNTTKATLKAAVTPAKGNVHTITITMDAGLKPITPGETITEGEYIMNGSVSQDVTLNGDNIKLTLDGVTANIGNAIKVTGGSPTLIVKGTGNSFNGNGAGILISPNASVTIEGATGNASDSKLTIKAGSSAQPGIGCADESSCKNITIKNVTLDVTGGSSHLDGGAAIGTAGSWGSSVNDILIENSIVTATGGTGAAAIGFGTIIRPNHSINSIKIINSQITAIVQYQSYQTYGYAAGIGFPYAAESSVLTIKQPIEITSTETNPAKYFSSFKAMKDGNIVSETIRKVGKPMNTHSHSVFSWQGATFNGQTLGDGTGY